MCLLPRRQRQAMEVVRRAQRALGGLVVKPQVVCWATGFKEMKSLGQVKAKVTWLFNNPSSC